MFCYGVGVKRSTLQSECILFSVQLNLNGQDLKASKYKLNIRSVHTSRCLGEIVSDHQLFIIICYCLLLPNAILFDMLFPMGKHLMQGVPKKGYPLMSSASAACSNLNALTC